MIKINNLPQNEFELYSPDNILIYKGSNINNYVDFKVQIKLKQLEGYYFKFKNQIFKISNKGETFCYTHYDEIFDKLNYLLINFKEKDLQKILEEYKKIIK